MRRLLGEPRSGQAMVVTALMMVVFFGMLAVVVDLGFYTIQRRMQQNAVDAAAMGAARLMAANVGVTSDNHVYYVDQTDATIVSRAQTLASNNWIGAGVTRTLTLQYLNCSGTVLGTAVAGGSSEVPVDTCRVRATGVSTMNTIFYRVVNPASTTMTISATATARIAPTSGATSTTGGLWPITRWLDYPGRNTLCPFVQGTLCTFWSNNGGSEDTSIGSWKEKVYLSHYSQFKCTSPLANQLITSYDGSRPGDNYCDSASSRQTDMEWWLRHGWGGTTTPSPQGKLSVGDKPETDTSGVQGNNYSDAMRDYINAAPEGTGAGASGSYRTIMVILWNDGQVYNSGTWSSWTHDTSHPPDRITISQLLCFKFYISGISSSAAQGHFVSCYTNNPPQSGPPSATANTVQMTD